MRDAVNWALTGATVAVAFCAVFLIASVHTAGVHL